MKILFILLPLIFFSTQSFADAFFGIGYTTQFKSLSSDFVKDKNDRMLILNLDGVNINSSFDETHKGKAGFSFSLGFGKNAYSNKKENYTDNTMFGVGFNFPVTDIVYIKVGGNAYFSKTKLRDESFIIIDESFEFENKDLTKYGLDIGIGAVIQNNVLLSFGYNSSINASSVNIGFKFR
jgi:hypothetical protein